jgi:hypothetical protein
MAHPELLQWTIDALYERELRAEKEESEEYGYKIGANLRISGVKSKVAELANSKTQEEFQKLNTDQKGSSLASLLKSILGEQSPVVLNDASKRKLRVIMVLQVMKAAMDPRQSGESKKLDIVSLGTNGANKFDRAYQAAMPAIFGGAGLPGVMNSLLNGSWEAWQQQPLGWFNEFVKEVFPEDHQRITEIITKIYSPITNKEENPTGNVITNKTKNAKELRGIVAKFNAKSLESLSRSSITQADPFITQADPLITQAEPKKSFWPNWVIKLTGFITGLFSNMFRKQESQQKKDNIDAAPFNNPAYGLDPQGEDFSGDLTVRSLRSTVYNPAFNYYPRPVRGADQSPAEDQIIDLAVRIQENNDSYSVAFKQITAEANAQSNTYYMLDVSKLPLNEKALMRLMHLDREMRDGGLPKNITVVGLQDRAAELNALLEGPNFQQMTLKAYQQRTWIQGPEATFHDDLKQLQEFINPAASYRL